MIAAALAAALLAGAAGSPPTAAPASNLPDGWYGDSGTPVAWQGTHVWLYDDVFDKIGGDGYPALDAEIHRNALVVDGQWIVDPLPKLPDGGYWWQDGVELPNGQLLVLATEFINRWDLEPPMQFEIIDTDAFVVSDPSDPMAWRWADKIEDGPWGNDSVQFLDQYPMVVARDPYAGMFGMTTELFRYDPADPTQWTEIPSNLPEGDAVVVPVQTEDGWWALTWSMWTDVTLWHADLLDGDWTEAADWDTTLQTHYHTLLVVDDVVLHRSNNLDGSRRPEYQEVNL